MTPSTRMNSRMSIDLHIPTNNIAAFYESFSLNSETIVRISSISAMAPAESPVLKNIEGRTYINFLLGAIDEEDEDEDDDDFEELDIDETEVEKEKVEDDVLDEDIEEDFDLDEEDDDDDDI